MKEESAIGGAEPISPRLGLRHRRSQPGCTTVQAGTSQLTGDDCDIYLTARQRLEPFGISLTSAVETLFEPAKP